MFGITCPGRRFGLPIHRRAMNVIVSRSAHAQSPSFFSVRLEVVQRGNSAESFCGRQQPVRRELFGLRHPGVRHLPDNPGMYRVHSSLVACTGSYVPVLVPPALQGTKMGIQRRDGSQVVRIQRCDPRLYVSERHWHHSHLGRVSPALLAGVAVSTSRLHGLTSRQQHRQQERELLVGYRPRC